MRNSFVINIQTVPLLEQIEKCDRKSEPHLEICPDSLPQMFQFTNLRQQRENRFDQHAVIPRPALTDFQIRRLVDFASKAGVCQNDHFLVNSFNERKKFLVGNIRRFHVPISDESEFIGQEAELSANNPFPRGKAFLADALPVRLMNFSNRMAQFNAVRIDHAEDSRFSQKLFSYLTMCFQAAKKSGAFRQIREKINPVLLNPSVKSVLRAALQSKQQAERDEFADRQLGLIVFLRFWQHVIYTAKKFYDKVFLSHGLCFLCIWLRHQYNRNISVTFSTSTSG